jgi:hypothetical protein
VLQVNRGGRICDCCAAERRLRQLLRGNAKRWTPR